MTSFWVPLTPDWQDGSGGGTPVNQANLDAMTAGIMQANNDVVAWVMNSAGTGYVHATGQKVQNFSGSLDPRTLPGITINDGDAWDQTT